MHIVFVAGVYEYATACLPTSYSGVSYCFLNIICSSEAYIEISTSADTISFTLAPGELYHKEISNDFLPIMGYESKALRVTSDVEILVLMYSDHVSSPFFNDAYMVPNQILVNGTYYTTAYDNDRACGSSGFKEFYLITSFQDETSVDVVQQDGTSFALELTTFGTFTQTTTDPDNHLATATKIASNKPINVISGNLCIYNYASGSAPGAVTYASFIPPVESLGQQYIVPKIINEDDPPPGFSLTIVATENNTVVESDGDMYLLNRGETAVLEYAYKDQSIFVNCSDSCLVTQFSKAIADQSGAFMQFMLPEHDFSTSAYFTTLDVQPMSFLSIVIQGESPGDDVYLNGTSLGYLTWTPVNGYTTTELPIPHGAYHLESEDGRPFAAYIYFHLKHAGGGAGYSLLPTESSRVTPLPTTSSSTVPSLSSTSPPLSPTPTTPSPSLNGTLPQHTARVNGTSVSADGEDIPPQCAVVSMHGKALMSKWKSRTGNAER